MHVTSETMCDGWDIIYKQKIQIKILTIEGYSLSNLFQIYTNIGTTNKGSKRSRKAIICEDRILYHILKADYHEILEQIRSIEVKLYKHYGNIKFIRLTTL